MSNLLTPRIKIIAPTPTTAQKVGDIIELKYHGHFVLKENGNHTGSIYLTPEEVAIYPHLYKQLEWWEERNPEELPEYVKSKITGRVYRVTLGSLSHAKSLSHLEPATLEEYTAFNSQKEKQ